MRDTESDPGWGWLGLACETTSLPCLHTFWHAIPTSFYIFIFAFCVITINYMQLHVTATTHSTVAA